MCYNSSLEEGSGKTLTVQNSTLWNNVAYSTSVFTKGGGIYAGDGLASVSLDQLMMVNNSADYGGAVFITGNYDVDITGSEFSGNTGMYGTCPSRQSHCSALHCTLWDLISMQVLMHNSVQYALYTLGATSHGVLPSGAPG